MKLKPPIIIGGILIATVLVGIIVARTTTDRTFNTSGSTTTTNMPVPLSTSSNTAEDGDRYVVFTPELLEAPTDKRRVLFFYANWCPTCAPVDTALTQSTDAIPEDVQVIRVNYNDTETDDQEKELAKRYGVTYQHTFVQINQMGEKVTSWNGGGVPELQENIQ